MSAILMIAIIIAALFLDIVVIRSLFL